MTIMYGGFFWFCRRLVRLAVNLQRKAERLDYCVFLATGSALSCRSEVQVNSEGVEIYLQLQNFVGIVRERKPNVVNWRNQAVGPAQIIDEFQIGAYFCT